MDSTYINMFLEMTQVASHYSKATRLKVGSLIVLNNQILSIGINGTPPGWETNDCEYEDENGELVTKPEVDHSEANAIHKLTQCTISSTGATLFCTHAPCLPCSKLIAGAGIKIVYYIKDYRCQDGIDYLKKRNIQVHQRTI